MSDESKSPGDEPFDPFQPPAPSQRPYGQQPPYGTPPPPGQQSYHQQPYGQQQYGHPHSYPAAYPAPEKKSSRPLWLGALAGLLLVGALFMLVFTSSPDLIPWLALGLALVIVLMLVVPATRSWGLGILIGVALSVPVGTIILAGVCVYLIVGYSGGTA